MAIVMHASNLKHCDNLAMIAIKQWPSTRSYIVGYIVESLFALIPILHAITHWLGSALVIFQIGQSNDTRSICALNGIGGLHLPPLVRLAKSFSFDHFHGPSLANPLFVPVNKNTLPFQMELT